MLKQDKRIETRVYEVDESHYLEIHLFGYEKFPVFEVWMWDDSMETKMWCCEVDKRDVHDWDGVVDFVERRLTKYIEDYCNNY